MTIKKSLLFCLLTFLSSGSGHAQNTEPLPVPTDAERAPVTRPATAEEILAMRQRLANEAGSAILSPGEAKSVRDKVIDAQGINAYGGKDGIPVPKPKPRIITLDANNVSADEPPQINLALGVVSPVSVIDSRGRPWPIATTVYDPRVFAQDGAGCETQTVQNVSPLSGEDRPNTISLMPCRYHSYGNIILKLEGYPLPLVIMLKSGDDNPHVDMPVTLQVKGKSPFEPTQTGSIGTIGAQGQSTAPSMRNAVSGAGGTTSDQILYAFANGTTPRGATRLSVKGGSVEAWLFQGFMYVRGRFALVNPSTVASAEGMNGFSVWKLKPTARILVMSDTGEEHSVTIDL